MMRVAHRGRSFSVTVEPVDLPDGRRIELDVVRHPGAAAIVPFEDDDTVLLIRQFRYCAQGVIWEIPAGKLDGDSPEACAARELEEEAGRRAGRLEHLGAVLTSPGFTDELIHLFAASDLESVPARPEDDEFIEVVPTRLDHALEMIWSGELNDGKSALALLHAAKRLGRLR